MKASPSTWHVSNLDIHLTYEVLALNTPQEFRPFLYHEILSSAEKPIERIFSPTKRKTWDNYSSRSNCGVLRVRNDVDDMAISGTS